MMHITEKFEHLKIPLQAINTATENFAEKNCIGRGGFGKVYRAELLLSGALTIVAIKRLDRKFGQGNPEFWKEIFTLSVYKHQNIVSLLGFCDENDEKILVYEYASRGSLDSYLNSDDLNWIQRLQICIGAARGLAYLHKPGETHQRVLHRDVKSSNILLDENWNARIADLGLCKFGPANQQYTFLVSNTVGTIGYCDPLYVESGLLTKESDVYSFGVVLFEVLCGRLSIGDNNEKRRPLTGLVRHYYEQNNISELIHANIKNEITSRSLQEFTDIAYQCLSIDLKKRPVMAKVVISLERALQYQAVDSNTPEIPILIEEPPNSKKGASDSTMEIVGDWRPQSFVDSRQREVNKIIDTLMALPFSGDEGLQELQRISQITIASLEALKELYLQELRPTQLEPQGASDTAGVSIESSDWRTQLQSDSRQRIVNKIFETLKRHLPDAGDEGLQELKKIAARFEDRMYIAATSQSDYLRKISLKMLTMETESQNPMSNTMRSNSTSNSVNPSSDDAKNDQDQTNERVETSRPIRTKKRPARFID